MVLPPGRRSGRSSGPCLPGAQGPSHPTPCPLPRFAPFLFTTSWEAWVSLSTPTGLTQILQESELPILGGQHCPHSNLVVRLSGSLLDPCPLEPSRACLCGSKGMVSALMSPGGGTCLRGPQGHVCVTLKVLARGRFCSVFSACGSWEPRVLLSERQPAPWRAVILEG